MRLESGVKPEPFSVENLIPISAYERSEYKLLLIGLPVLR